MEKLLCPKCNGKTVRNGFQKGKQRYKCKCCGGTVKSSSIVNGILMGVAFINPVVGGAVLIYSIGDYFFDFSGSIDEKFGEHKLWD
jgi:hypothetical protein